MQKLGLTQSLSQKLSPQQIQFIKLLQVPTAELEARIEEELESNPALEEGPEEKEPDSETEDFDSEYENDSLDDIEEYLHDDYSGYKMQGDGNSPDEDKEMPISVGATLHEQLISQLGYVRMTDRERILGKQLIGSIDADGYIRRELEAIVNDLAFSQGVDTDAEELENVLYKIQGFDPAGIGARNLQECLMLQLERKDESHQEVKVAKQIVERCFDEFSKKHYDKIARKLNIEDEELLKEAIASITKLNPKPGGVGDEIVKTQYLIPDFLLTNNNGKLELTLNSRNAPLLNVSRSYSEMLHAYDKSDKKDKKLKETVTFIKQKLDSAKWFIDAIKQRQQTLLNTMQAIINFQYDYFQEGDESQLKPMILKDIAEKIGMDISTVSRVANSKSIQTEFGIYPLKYFFSEGIATDSGEDVSSREVKNKLKEFIDKESKEKPLSDDKLEKLLRAEGYNIARRTVAKYREQLNIPVARLRKQL
ncbi:RNA polymerase factor sigma-54 [Marinoscillum sp. MHG1-6]|uniref:RNA polymerase factor sigma-54 n=1 Tax=Marinoscillum sp. MHG1-6 TaxID=2959627 RepID=UPI0021588652|nr:RNA polymerase factor sigma-54 [Marinoscillum sp. MHG1-6]